MEVKEHVIALLDVLGYKNLLLKKAKSGKENEFLQQIHHMMYNIKYFIETRNRYLDEKANREHSSSERIMTKFNSLLYSDNILFFAPYNNDIEKENLYNNLAYGISSFLFQYPKEDIFFRGAITEGTLFYDEQLHFVYGTGLVRAYELEASISIYPRIIIDRQMKVSPILFGYQKDFDEEWFIDYLRYGHYLIQNAVAVRDESEERIYSSVSNHKEAIQKGIQENQNNERVLQKYLWLAHYHNNYCREYKMEQMVIKIPE